MPGVWMHHLWILPENLGVMDADNAPGSRLWSGELYCHPHHSVSLGLPVCWPPFGGASEGNQVIERCLPHSLLWKSKVIRPHVCYLLRPTYCVCFHPVRRFLHPQVPGPTPGEEKPQRKRGHCLLPHLPSVPEVTHLALCCHRVLLILLCI